MNYCIVIVIVVIIAFILPVSPCSSSSSYYYCNSPWPNLDPGHPQPRTAAQAVELCGASSWTRKFDELDLFGYRCTYLYNDFRYTWYMHIICRCVYVDNICIYRYTHIHTDKISMHEHIQNRFPEGSSWGGESSQNSANISPQMTRGLWTGIFITCLWMSLEFGVKLKVICVITLYYHYQLFRNQRAQKVWHPTWVWHFRLLDVWHMLHDRFQGFA